VDFVEKLPASASAGIYKGRIFMGDIRKVAVPVISALCTEKTRDDYLAELRRAGASRV